ncbi:MAG: hypothetical protein EOM23_08985 [Candidatus Moranbacteria bacterium]|nr:hypothetical protein [Candidatus Moranbacteria bacterium]
MAKNKLSKQEKRIRKLRMDVSLNAFGKRLENESNKRMRVLTGVNEKQYGIKVSEALRIVCEPFLEGKLGQKPEMIKSLFILGIIAWNMAVMGKSTEDKDIADIFDNLKENCGDIPDIGVVGKGKELFLECFQVMINRKQELFPDVNCVILEHELTWDGDNPRLMVATVPYEGDYTLPHDGGLFHNVKEK